LLPYRQRQYSGLRVDPEGFRAGILFFSTTNVTDKSTNLTLSASAADVSVLNVVPLSEHPDEREIMIEFHKGDLLLRHLAKKWENHALTPRFFEELGSFVITMSTLGTNVLVLHGEIRVMANSSLSWNFPIPEQRTKHGVLTAKFRKTREGKLASDVMPTSLGTFWGEDKGTYDGK
jgi:hypothetical protein